MNQVGRYQIQEELGRVAMGVVYKALDPSIDRTVAIKSIRLADVRDPDERGRLRERLLHDAQQAAVLSHPNIIAVYDVLEQEEFAYILMEYVQGESLEKMLQNGSLPLDLMLYLRQVAEALDYAHHKGVVHRDVKPANIIIAEPGSGTESLAKIADFGLTRLMPHEMTNNGTVIAASNYLSPEQIQGTTINARSDQFSFGIVVYELLTGAKPFRADDLSALFYSICKQDARPAMEVNPSLSEAASKVLQRALMKDPEQRFASCSAFIAALSIALGEASLPGVSSVQPALNRATPHDAAATVLGASPTKPIIFIPEEPPQELPTRIRRRRDERDSEGDQSFRRYSGSKKLALILAICFAIGAAIVFIVASNSGPTVPVQVLDTKSGPLSPPPEGMEVSNGQPRSTSQTSTLHGPTQLAANRLRQEYKSSGPRLPLGSPSPAARAPVANDATDVELLTEPPGAKMVVDGRSDLTCNAPCTLSLTNGRHTVSAELAGYNIGRRIFTTPSEASLFVNLGKSMGVVVVTSAQSGCSVLVDGHPSGYTPATLHLTAGSHRIAVMSKASRHEETVQVQTDGFDVERFLCQ